MSERLVYLIMVVATGWAVTFALRSLPFVIFAGKNRELPPWVERLGAFISPVIIFGLIVYSYSGLEWRTVWPYLAGILTVGLQVWKRNPLVSIISGTVLYMVLVANCGCASTPDTIRLDAKNPAFSVTKYEVKFGDEAIDPSDAADLLDDFGIPKTRTIHIMLDPEVKDLSQARTLMGYLAKGGYKRPILVTKRHGVSFATGKKPPKKYGAKSAKVK